MGVKAVSAASMLSQSASRVRAAAFAIAFEFSEGHLDRVEVGRIGWKIDQCRVDGFDQLSRGDLVGREIVRDDDVAGR